METITFLRFYRAAYLRRGPRTRFADQGSTIENGRLFANSKQNIYVWNLKLQDYRQENFFVYITCLVTHSFIRIHFKTLRLVCVISSLYIRIPRRGIRRHDCEAKAGNFLAKTQTNMG